MAKPSVLSLALAAVLGFAAVVAAQQSATEEATRHARESFDQSDDTARVVADPLVRKVEKRHAAFLLVLHGAEDPRYLEFLLDNARKALEGDPPGVLDVDEEGRAIRGELSEEFIAWATERELDPEVAAGERLYGAVTDVTMVAAVATTDRPATVDLLLRAIEARDPMVVLTAAEGLARLQVEPARKRLVELALSGGHDLAKGLALVALPLYDDPETLAVAEKVLDDPELFAAVRRQRALDRQVASGEPD